MANRDVGHAFPTYITPRVFLVIHQVDASGGVELADTQVEGVIGREVDLGDDGRAHGHAHAPRRVAAKLDYAARRASPVWSPWSAASRVDPDFHYRGVFEFLPAATAIPRRAR